MSTATPSHLRIDGGSARRDTGVPIPYDLRRSLESLVDCDLSTVRLRVDAGLAAIGACACAQGEDITFGDAVDLATPAGVAILGHELAHVLQQRAGQASPSADDAVVADPRLEAEANWIGAYCAARVFGGAPGEARLPPPCPQARYAQYPAATPAPIQFLRTSVQSFADFVIAAWQFLSWPATGHLSDVQNLRYLYAWAANYNPNGVPPKASLFGTPRYRSMATYIQATQLPAQHLIRLQEGAWPNLTNDVGNFAAYYTAVANLQSPPLNPQAEKVALRYLHVYPAQQAAANWRIGLNVKPQDMAAAMTALAPLLNNFPDIDHMKFLGPGLDSKADSVIVYLRHDNARYALLRDAVLNAVAALNLEPRVGAMWEEIDDGVGEAAEPPAGSFTTYRCVIVYLAYLQLAAGGTPSFADFRQFLVPVMALFGLDPARPHLQGPPQAANPVFPSWWNAFQILHHAWQG